MKRILASTFVLGLSVFASGATSAFTIDGADIPAEGLPLLATQDAATSFGDAVGGGQDSNGGSELDQLFGELDGDTLRLGLTGNLEGNFNKLWIFFDAIPGGERTLAGDNEDGGFNEIQNLAGLSFDGAAMDRALRLEVGGGFLGVRYADLIGNTGGDVYTAGGTDELPLADVAGALGITLGWDNSNVDGVNGDSAADAATATTGWEFAIDMPTFVGASVPGVKLTAFVTSGDGSFISSQVLPGFGGGNVGSPNSATLGAVQIGVPEPASAALAIASGLLLAASRRRWPA